MYENKPHAPENLSLNGQEKDIHRWMHTHPNTKPPPQQQKKKKKKGQKAWAIDSVLPSENTCKTSRPVGQVNLCLYM